MKKQQKNVAKGKAAETRGATAAHTKAAETPVAPKAEYRAMEKVAKSIETACRIRRKDVMAMQTATEMSHRVLTMAEYLAMEKVASAIERACRVRRKYVMAMKGATEVIDRNLDKLREIVWSDGVK